MKQIMKKITFGLAVLGSLFVLQAPLVAFAQSPAPNPAPTGGGTTKDAVCEGVGLTGTNCDPAGSGSNVEGIVKTVVNILSFVIGIAAVIMIMIGGFKYITSQGDGNSVSSAKNTILYAVVGLVVALMAQVIVRFVIFRTTTPSTPAPLPKCTQPGQQNCTP